MVVRCCLKVTHLLFVNLVMDGLGALMLGNEPALAEYMNEKPRRRDESIISKSMGIQILIMALWLTFVSFVFLKVPFFLNIFGSMEKLKTGYFVFFIAAALFNGFNVRDDGMGIFKGLKENFNFVKNMIIIMAIQALIVNAALIPLEFFTSIGKMFSCTLFGIYGWITVLILASTVIPIDLTRKFFSNSPRPLSGTGNHTV